MKKILVLGCGKTKIQYVEPVEEVTLDYNADHQPSVVHDLEVLPYPFRDNEFDEIMAFEVLEHTGAQGDYKFFFAQFSELHRILKPNGLLVASCPNFSSMWAWGDPSHKRVINLGTLAFLSQKEYERQVGKTAMSDFRNIYKADFDVGYYDVDPDTFRFTLKAVKSV